MMNYGFSRPGRPQRDKRGARNVIFGKRGRPITNERCLSRPLEIKPPRPGPISGIVAPSQELTSIPGTGIAVSAVLSIHNRSVLFKRALDGYLWQTLPPDRWEIILVDDMSTEDLRHTYKDLIGKINIRHILMDHTKHPVFKERNPGWKPGKLASWFHTPALSLNIGFTLARGAVICLCHPEVLHAPQNFERAARRLARENAFLFGTTYLGIQETNRWLDQYEWTGTTWRGFLENIRSHALKKFRSDEFYWYTSFLPTTAARAVGGVDFRYLNGVAAEDDDFRERVLRGGWPPIYAPEIEGLHQDHSHEREAHHRRDTVAWRDGLKANRALFYKRKREGFLPWMANPGIDFTAMECVVGEISYEIGSSSPVIERRP